MCSRTEPRPRSADARVVVRRRPAQLVDGVSHERLDASSLEVAVDGDRPDTGILDESDVSFALRADVADDNGSTGSANITAAERPTPEPAPVIAGIAAEQLIPRLSVAREARPSALVRPMIRDARVGVETHVGKR